VQDLNDMLYFAEVVDRGGFAAAGRALGIPKSRLSRRVAELEARLGVRLMQRTTRKLSLTEAGERYHRHCAAMRDEAAAAAEAVAQVQPEPRVLEEGQVRARVVLYIFLERHHEHGKFILEIMQAHANAHIRFVDGGAQIHILLPIICPQKIERELDQTFFIVWNIHCHHARRI